MKFGTLLPSLIALTVVTVQASADPAVPSTATESAVQRLVEEDTQELFLRCCWAKGRAGFHFCEEYGVCESDPEATCKGVGAAEGKTMSCKGGPPPSIAEGG